MTAILDHKNRALGDWHHDFNPFISLATLDRVAADNTVLEAFQAIMPEAVTLWGAQARVG